MEGSEVLEAREHGVGVQISGRSSLVRRSWLGFRSPETEVSDPESFMFDAVALEAVRVRC